MVVMVVVGGGGRRVVVGDGRMKGCDKAEWDVSAGSRIADRVK